MADKEGLKSRSHYQGFDSGRNQEVCKKQLFDTGSNFRAKASRPPPLLLYAAHNSHDLCGKYLLLAARIQIYLFFHACWNDGLTCWPRAN
jgi:hypothetical protein